MPRSFASLSTDVQRARLLLLSIPLNSRQTVSCSQSCGDSALNSVCETSRTCFEREVFRSRIFQGSTNYPPCPMAAPAGIESDQDPILEQRVTNRREARASLLYRLGNPLPTRCATSLIVKKARSELLSLLVDSLMEMDVVGEQRPASRVLSMTKTLPCLLEPHGIAQSYGVSHGGPTASPTTLGTGSRAVVT